MKTSGYQLKYGTPFSSYSAFEKKLLENDFVSCIVNNPVTISSFKKVEVEVKVEPELGHICYIRRSIYEIYISIKNKLREQKKVNPSLIKETL